MEEVEIRDTRNGEWHWVYNALLSDPHLTPGEKLVYSSIATFGGHQTIHPTKEQLAGRCGLDPKTVQRALGRLEEVGYLRAERGVGRGNASVYYLLKRPKGCKLCPFIKGDIYDHKRGLKQPLLGGEKGTKTTPHIDIVYKDKIDTGEASLRIESESEENRRPKRTPKDTAYRAVFELFESPHPLKWAKDTTQIEAARRLLAQEGIEELSLAMKFYRKHSKDKFCPKIRSPWELEEKWEKLGSYYDNHQTP